MAATASQPDRPLRHLSVFGPPVCLLPICLCYYTKRYYFTALPLANCWLQPPVGRIGPCAICLYLAHLSVFCPFVCAWVTPYRFLFFGKCISTRSNSLAPANTATATLLSTTAIYIKKEEKRRDRLLVLLSPTLVSRVIYVSILHKKILFHFAATR